MSDENGLRAAIKRHRAVGRLKEDAFQANRSYHEDRLDWRFLETVSWVAIVATVVGMLLAKWAVTKPDNAMVAIIVGIGLTMWPVLRDSRAMKEAQEALEVAGLRGPEPPRKPSKEQVEAAKAAPHQPAWPGPIVELREDGYGEVVERVHIEAMRRNRLKHVPDDALYYVTIDHPGGPGWLLVAEGRSDDDDPEELVWWCPRLKVGDGRST